MDLSPIDNYHRAVSNGLKPDAEAFEKCYRSPDFRREWEIRIKEIDLGIYHHPARRTVEASLFIEPKFLHTAIAMGEPEHSERLFGHDEWLGYLDARLYAREYGDQPLTIEFIQEIHRRLLHRVHPDAAGQLKQGGNEGFGGRFLYGMFLPLSFTAEQFAKVRQNNGLVRFEVEYEYGHGVRAKIHYLPFSQDELHYELECMCKWYNQADRTDPVDLAATLQRSFVSLHPMARDMNGRTSRILLNWSLENHGLPPSSLDDFDADIFSSQEEWTEAVRTGCQTYSELLRRSKLMPSPLGVFGLEAARKAFLDQLDEGKTVPILEIGEQHEHIIYDAFWHKLQKRIGAAALATE